MIDRQAEDRGFPIDTRTEGNPDPGTECRPGTYELAWRPSFDD
jgi:hypothetical protein